MLLTAGSVGWIPGLGTNGMWLMEWPKIKINKSRGNHFFKKDSGDGDKEIWM